jgi:hypothetical protein
MTHPHLRIKPHTYHLVVGARRDCVCIWTWASHGTSGLKGWKTAAVECIWKRNNCIRLLVHDT